MKTKQQPILEKWKLSVFREDEIWHKIQECAIQLETWTAQCNFDESNIVFQNIKRLMEELAKNQITKTTKI